MMYENDIFSIDRDIKTLQLVKRRVEGKVDGPQNLFYSFFNALYIREFWKHTPARTQANYLCSGVWPQAKIRNVQK
jgi:hypothetical protein